MTTIVTFLRFLFLTSSVFLNSTDILPPSSNTNTTTNRISSSSDSSSLLFFANRTTILPTVTNYTTNGTTIDNTNNGSSILPPPIVISSSSYFTDTAVSNVTIEGRSYSTIYGNFFTGAGVAVFASICWSVWYVWSREASYATLVPLWIIYISLGDFISDFTFISQMPRTPELIDTLRTSSIAFIMGASLLNVCVMVGYMAHILLKGGPEFTPFVRWLQVHRGVTVALLILSVTSARMFTLIFSGLFGISMFNAPLPISAMEILDLLGIITVIFEDVPQLIINIYISDATDTWDSVSYTAVAFSIVSVAISVGCRSITLIYYNDKSRQHMQNAVLVDHLKGQRAFRKGTISHVRHMFDGGGTLGDPTPRRWSVRGTKMPEIMQMLQKITKPKDAVSSIDSDRDPMAVHNVYAVVAKPLVVNAGTHIEPGQTPTSGNMMDALAAAYEMSGPSPPYYSTVNVLQQALNNDAHTNTVSVVYGGSPYSVKNDHPIYRITESPPQSPPLPLHSNSNTTVSIITTDNNTATTTQIIHSSALPPLRYPSEGSIEEARSPIGSSGTLGPLPTLQSSTFSTTGGSHRIVGNPFYNISRESSGTGLIPLSPSSVPTTPTVLPPPLPPAVSFSRSISATSTSSIDSSSQLIGYGGVTENNAMTGTLSSHNIIPEYRGRVAATASIFNHNPSSSHNLLHTSHTSIRNILPPVLPTSPSMNGTSSSTTSATTTSNRAERVGKVAIGMHINPTSSTPDTLSPYISPSNHSSAIVPSPAPTNFMS